LLKAEREGKAPTRVATDLLLRACDALSDLIEDLASAQTGTPATEEMCASLAQASGHPVPSMGPARTGARPATPVPATPTTTPAVPAVLPAPAALAATAQLAPPERSAASPRPAEATGSQEDVPAARATAADRSIRVNVETLDALGLLAGDLLVESARS